MGIMNGIGTPSPDGARSNTIRLYQLLSEQAADQSLRQHPAGLLREHPSGLLNRCRACRMSCSEVSSPMSSRMPHGCCRWSSSASTPSAGSRRNSPSGPETPYTTTISECQIICCGAWFRCRHEVGSPGCSCARFVVYAFLGPGAATVVRRNGWVPIGWAAALPVSADEHGPHRLPPTFGSGDLA